MFIHRPDRYATEKDFAEGKIQKNVAELIVAKHRNGRTDTVKLYFKGECTKFLNLNTETGEPEGEEGKNSSKPQAENGTHSAPMSGTEELPPPPEDAPTAENAPPFDESPFGGAGNVSGDFFNDKPKPSGNIDDEIF